MQCGKGVFAIDQVEAGEVVAIYDGPEFDSRGLSWTPDLLAHAIQIGPTTFKDSIGIARYINHSCSPNCGIAGSDQIITMRIVKAGEELTWDYAMTEDNRWRMVCKCSSPNCRGVVGSFVDLTEQQRKEYQGFVALWLVEKYKLPGRKW